MFAERQHQNSPGVRIYLNIYICKNSSSRVRCKRRRRWNCTHSLAIFYKEIKKKHYFQLHTSQGKLYFMRPLCRYLYLNSTARVRTRVNVFSRWTLLFWYAARIVQLSFYHTRQYTYIIIWIYIYLIKHLLQWSQGSAIHRPKIYRPNLIFRLNACHRKNCQRIIGQKSSVNSAFMLAEKSRGQINFGQINVGPKCFGQIIPNVIF